MLEHTYLALIEDGATDETITLRSFFDALASTFIAWRDAQFLALWERYKTLIPAERLIALLPVVWEMCHELDPRDAYGWEYEDADPDIQADQAAHHLAFIWFHRNRLAEPYPHFNKNDVEAWLTHRQARGKTVRARSGTPQTQLSLF